MIGKLNLIEPRPYAKRIGGMAAVSLLLLFASLTFGQTTSPSPQIQAIQNQAWSSMMGANKPKSLSLNGTFSSTAGSLHDEGSIQLTVNANGNFSVTRSGSRGFFGEARTGSSGIPSCTWTDSENIAHSPAILNCIPPAWFFPNLSLLSANSANSIATWTPTSVTSDALGDHLDFQLIVPTEDGALEDPQLMKPFELVLSPNTHLPLYALYTAHPDDPRMHADISVTVAYSNYQSVSGVMIPFRIQRYLNGSLVLDISITAASVQ